jgi:SNF2 family DNA or RNA helicase
MEVWTQGNKAIVKCTYQEKELVKAIGDFKFNKSNFTWEFPLKKLVDIIENLRINYSTETEGIYQQLRTDRQRLHSLINTANIIKAGKYPYTESIELNHCYKHQIQAFHLASLFDSYALFMETGTGKTLVAIKLMEYWKVPAMVVAPLSTIESVWKREIDKWSKLRATILWQNLKDFDEDFDVYLINYEQFKILSQKSKVPIEKKVQCLIIDESSKMKNPKSEITKTILKYKNNIPHRLVLSGTPSPNSLLEYWGQMEFINDELL